MKEPMAPSTSLKLISPFKVWLVINLCLGILVVVVGFQVFKLSTNEAQRLAESQINGLVKSHMRNLEEGDFRNFVEGLGSELPETFVRIGKDGANEFSVGSQSSGMICAHRSVEFRGQLERLNISLCRTVGYPFSALVSILFGFLIVSGASSRSISRSLLSFSKYHILSYNYS